MVVHTHVKENAMTSTSSIDIFPLKEGYSTTRFSRKTGTIAPLKPQSKYQSNSQSQPQEKMSRFKTLDEELTFIKRVVKEVKQLPQRDRLKLQRKMKKAGELLVIPTLLTLVMKPLTTQASGLGDILPYLQERNISRSSAQITPTQDGGTIPVDGDLVGGIKSLGILPPDVVDLLVDIIVTCGVIGFFTSIICLMITGGFWMIGQRERARQWTTDILKGLGQIFLSPVVIILLTLLTTMLLGDIAVLDLFY